MNSLRRFIAQVKDLLPLGKAPYVRFLMIADTYQLRRTDDAAMGRHAVHGKAGNVACFHRLIAVCILHIVYKKSMELSILRNRYGSVVVFYGKGNKQIFQRNLPCFTFPLFFFLPGDDVSFDVVDLLAAADLNRTQHVSSDSPRHEVGIYALEVVITMALPILP